MEHIERRSKTVQLSQSTREAIKKFYAHRERTKGIKRDVHSVEEPSLDSSCPPEAKRRRCHLCPSQLSKMQKQCCSKCFKNVCNGHSTQFRECSACKQ